MSTSWSTVRLGEVLKRVKDEVHVQDDETYARLTIRMNGRGIARRDLVPGHDIGTKKQFVARSGQLVLSKIDARNGAFGVLSKECDNAIITGNFWAFDADHERLLPAYFDYLTKTPLFVEFCVRASEGTTNRRYLQEDRFLAQEIQLPPLAEQRRLVARIEDLTVQLREARHLRHDAAAEAEALIQAQLNRRFGNPYKRTFGTLSVERWSKIGEVVEDVADGPHVTPAYVDDGIPFITALNITSGRVCFDHHKSITPEDHAQYQRRAKAERGDVLITKDGTIGVPCFIDTDREFSFFVSVALIKPKRAVLDGEYLTWTFRVPYMQERIAARSRGDMIRHLVLREIRDLTIPLPPLTKQREIVLELNDLQSHIDALRGLQAQTEAAFDALVPAILDRAFKGELV